MSNLAFDMRRDWQAGIVPATGRFGPEVEIGRVPRITLHAYCESAATVAEITIAARDRRMARAHVSVSSGGIPAAMAQYRHAPTPNLIILESQADHEALLNGLDALANVCDVGTRVIVIGQSNDIDLYRELMKRGISDYLCAPVSVAALIAAVAGSFGTPGAAKLGRIYAFIGARGGVGSSTIAHNVAATLSRFSGADVLLADMDLAFGTASLNFGLEPATGLADAICEAGRLDEQMLDRLLTRCDDHLSLLAAPALADAPCELTADTFDDVLDLAQTTVSHVVLDVPHVWAPWTRKTLVAADEIVITATPDLTSLKHAKHLIEALRLARPHDPEPRLVLNQVGMPKRPEIKPADFAEALNLTTTATLPFDAAAFGEAANNGRMLANAPGRGAPAAFRDLADVLSGRASTTEGVGLLSRLFRRGKPPPQKA